MMQARGGARCRYATNVRLRSSAAPPFLPRHCADVPGRCSIDHRVFVVGILRQRVEHLFPQARAAPAGKAGVYATEVTNAFGQIAPRECRPDNGTGPLRRSSDCPERLRRLGPCGLEARARYGFIGHPSIDDTPWSHHGEVAILQRAPCGQRNGQEAKKKGLHRCKPLNLMVARDGIEPPTRGFSIPCSTN